MPARIELIPLEERPANTRDPVLIGAVAGGTVVLPPVDLLSHRRAPAATGTLGKWPRDDPGRLAAAEAWLEP
ncbi:MAG: DUF4127 family protein [Chloroflexia bacterium]|nr:DUF4127 family protein [Chloroflexia bacterium]